MTKTTHIIVKEVSVSTLKVSGTDYISITDIARQKNPIEPKDVVKNWMRLKNTLEYLGLWEQLNNPAFKGVEFDPILRDAGNNAFTMSPSRWVELTGAIGLMFINENLQQKERLIKLNQIAIQQMKVLQEVESRKILK